MRRQAEPGPGTPRSRIRWGAVLAAPLWRLLRAWSRPEQSHLCTTGNRLTRSRLTRNDWSRRAGPWLGPGPPPHPLSQPAPRQQLSAPLRRPPAVLCRPRPGSGRPLGEPSRRPGPPLAVKPQVVNRLPRRRHTGRQPSWRPRSRKQGPSSAPAPAKASPPATGAPAPSGSPGGQPGQVRPGQAGSTPHGAPAHGAPAHGAPSHEPAPPHIARPRTAPLDRRPPVRDEAKVRDKAKPKASQIAAPPFRP